MNWYKKSQIVFNKDDPKFANDLSFMTEKDWKKLDALQWWKNLSINQMKTLTRKYYPNQHITWSFINQTTGLIEDIYSKEHMK